MKIFFILFTTTIHKWVPNQVKIRLNVNWPQITQTAFWLLKDILLLKKGKITYYSKIMKYSP